MTIVGHKIWAIPEGYIPEGGLDGSDNLICHEAACILNTSAAAAHVKLTLFFVDRPPLGPYRITVPAQRTLHLRFNDLSEPERVPRNTDYASLFESDVPIVVQHTRLDSRHPNVALLSTIAFPAGAGS
jgi:hypothetical protein